MTHAGCVMMSLCVVTIFSHKCDQFVRNIIIYTVQTEILSQQKI